MTRTLTPRPLLMTRPAQPCVLSLTTRDYQAPTAAVTSPLNFCCMIIVFRALETCGLLRVILAAGRAIPCNAAQQICSK